MRTSELLFIIKRLSLSICFILVTVSSTNFFNSSDIMYHLSFLLPFISISPIICL
nr:MAG TPA: hypothetical protein [Caudoviricetes sp.]